MSLHFSLNGLTIDLLPAGCKSQIHKEIIHRHSSLSLASLSPLHVPRCRFWTGLETLLKCANVGRASRLSVPSFWFMAMCKSSDYPLYLCHPVTLVLSLPIRQIFGVAKIFRIAVWFCSSLFLLKLVFLWTWVLWSVLFIAFLNFGSL